MDPVLSGLRAALAGRYEVEQELGRGGMAVVYLARDARHERKVALKVLRRDIGASTAVDRFLLEIRTAARLDHPHILSIHDSGAVGDDLFYVMPYVEGESLRQRLERTGALPLEEALQIAGEVADALHYAHERGVVHRDIKPENILLSAGHARVADFGIARAIDAAGGRMTDTGLAIGTPTYMSPEQALADPHLDGRADQYALGCVLYEMLAGTPPFTGPTSQAIMARHTADDVPPLTTVREVPPMLDGAVRRALAKHAADRWPDTRAFAVAIQQAVPSGGRSVEVPVPRARSTAAILALALGGLAVAAGLGFWMTRANGNESAGASGRSVAVLPATFSGDTAKSLYADGLTEALITELVRVPGVKMPVTSRLAQFRDGLTDPREAGSALGVDVVVTSAVQVRGNRIRVTGQLTQVADGVILWRDDFDGDLQRGGEIADVFLIQDEFAAKLVAALALRLAGEARTIASVGQRTKSPDAYRLYLLAQQVSAWGGKVSRNLTPRQLSDSAVALLRETVRIDSTFADAWASLARELSWKKVFGGISANDLAVDIRQAADRAIELDPLNAMAYGVRAGLRMSYDWDWDESMRDIRRVAELAPSSPEAALLLVSFFENDSKPDSALKYARRAVSLDPTNSFFAANFGTRFARAGMPDSAMAWSNRAIALDSAQWVAYWVRMHILLDRGQKAAADSAAESYTRYGGYIPDVLALAAYYHRRAGNSEAPIRMLGELERQSKVEFVAPVHIGIARLAAGDTSGALDALEVSMHQRALEPWHLALSYSPLRGHPRYEAIVRRLYGDRPLPFNPFPWP